MKLTFVLEDNDIEIYIVCLGSRGKKLVKISFSDHSPYDQFKQNLKRISFLRSMLEVLYNYVKGDISSSLINLCHYITEYYEDKFVSAAGDSGFTFSDSIPDIETTSMMNDDYFTTWRNR